MLWGTVTPQNAEDWVASRSTIMSQARGVP